MNGRGILAIYRYELARTRRTVFQSVVSPVLSTALYFVVFGSAIGSRIQEVEGIAYGAFIVPGLIMMSVLTQSISNAAFAIYFPRFTGTVYELLSAPVSPFEVVLGYVGAATTKAIILGCIILATASVIVPVGRISVDGHTLAINDARPGTLATRLYDRIVDIQRGDAPDPHGWNRLVASGPR